MKKLYALVPAGAIVGATSLAHAGGTFTPPEVDLSNFYTGAGSAITALVAVIGVLLVFSIYGKIKGR